VAANVNRQQMAGKGDHRHAGKGPGREGSARGRACPACRGAGDQPVAVPQPAVRHAGPAAVAAAEAFVAPGAWVPHLALAEAMWVLESVYALKARAVRDRRADVPTHYAPSHCLNFLSRAEKRWRFSSRASESAPVM